MQLCHEKYFIVIIIPSRCVESAHVTTVRRAIGTTYYYSCKVFSFEHEKPDIQICK